MSRDVWDPDQYAAFSDERGRAYFELVGQVRASAPGRVIDLGCGDGSLTATLTRRWPDATVEGIDSSPEMIALAAKLAGPTSADVNGSGHHTSVPQGSLAFAVGDVSEWRPDGQVDVIVSNAALHWVDGHQALLPTWVEGLSAGGWLAFQVPGNFHLPSHVTVREVCASPRWEGRLGGVLPADPVSEPAEYLKILAGLGCQVNVWETTYLQVLPGPDPVLEWLKGSALRPALTRLKDDEQAQADFLRDCRDRLREAYPSEPFGTVFPFRRIFAVARKAP